MQRFDCLARDCPLFGPHLLEASAGTGKTFSIEHIYVRLVLESLEVEQILAVTFTRAATRELKARIRTNLEKALAQLESGQPIWDYLQTYVGLEDPIHRLTDALAGFDRCQIFTIHGFCYRMLREFAFEAKGGFPADPDRQKALPERLKRAAVDFLEHGIDESLLCPEQMALLFKQFESVEEIASRLLRLEKVGVVDSFSGLFAKCKAALHWVDEGKLLEDFRALQKGYKAEVKGDFEGQVRALARLTDLTDKALTRLTDKALTRLTDKDDPESLRTLLKERGSLFDFLDPHNRKVRAQEPVSLHYPGFFERARLQLAPLLKQKVFPVLQSVWNPIAEKILFEEEQLSPDEILARMRQATLSESFASRVRQKYKAAIIDEFQDTDAAQWDIFQSLFFGESLKALYLVGDPKQSIYRFRKADIYTYLQARDFVGEERVYHLDTNFRSSAPLLGALNALFSRDWLHLPKAKRVLPYISVRAGAKIDSHFPDEKGALHFFTAEGEPHALFEESFLPFAVSEIERLNVKNCALLVKDRYQAERALALCKARGIAAVAKSHTPLGQTVSFQAIRELFDAILSPRDSSAAKIVMAGPFGPSELPWLDYRALLEEKGIVPLARELAHHFDADGMQIFEHLFAWERREGFSFEGLQRALQALQKLDSEEGGRRRMEVDESAVQILTLHIAKGLEFDVVFALGLASRTPAAEEEIEELEAEKQRQLYVAMTRAKRRLYVPIALSEKEAEAGTHSPIELFSRHFEGLLLNALQALSQQESITIEAIPTPLILGSPISNKPVAEHAAPLPIRHVTPCYLSSFTTLARTQESAVKWSGPQPGIWTLQTMPRGAETGLVIHALFEELFRAQQPLWKSPAALDIFVEEQLRVSPLAPWKGAIQQMVRQTIAMPLRAGEESFSLGDVDRFQVEMEFLFSASPHWVKGFIDLVFAHRGKLYFVDWKTNWLEDYSPASLQAAMQVHDYGLQASLYTEAIQRHFRGNFGGAFYIFVRGCAPLYIDPSQGEGPHGH